MLWINDRSTNFRRKKCIFSGKIELERFAAYRLNKFHLRNSLKEQPGIILDAILTNRE
jgi:hypothetical protein